MEIRRISEKEYICWKCLKTFLAKRVKKVCPHCGAKWQNEIKANYDQRMGESKKKTTELDKVLLEMAEYNQQHGTSLSYGQYVNMLRK